ncbi:hypothetical protein QYE76_056904 [Lolium multiflorum]|uniref:Uncharacterized protein n=1 Tax=Lolium multiflorum TaxID=4521 RepID=A0AAD8VTE9_LOLMU|nr:hypothetical protein QYE76_022668 [Lolium multiflorum]KAK1668745.1 hypothetical protein QYE76_056904 [Lolium multiflorum]
MPRQHQGRARHGVDMAMPAMSHLDTPPLSSLHRSPHDLAKHVAHDLRRSPVPAVEREDDDTTRTTRAQDAPASPSTSSHPDRRRSKLNRKVGAAEALVKSPSIGAAPGAAAGTRSIAVVYTFVEPTANPSWSHGELSDPLPESPANSSLAVDDDKREPLIRMEPNEPLNTKFYQLGNGGELIFEHDLNALSDFLGRPHPEFHGIEVNDQVGGELQWIITADLRGKLEPPTSERILFSFRESNWLDGLARGLQEALARLCGQNVVRILASRYAHLVRRDAMGVPMELQSHPQLRHHAEHLDYMLYHTQKELDNSRAYANQTHLALITHGDAIKQLSRDRNKLRLKCAKKDVTITRLRAQIASLEATVKAQEEQLMEIEEDEAGADLRGGDAFLSDDDDYEEDEFTEEEDYAFLEPGPDDVVPIDIEDEGSHT